MTMTLAYCLDDALVGVCVGDIQCVPQIGRASCRERVS